MLARWWRKKIYMTNLGCASLIRTNFHYQKVACNFHSIVLPKPRSHPLLRHRIITLHPLLRYRIITLVTQFSTLNIDSAQTLSTIRRALSI